MTTTALRPASNTTSATADVAVSTRGLRKKFGSFEAVAGIDLTVYRGEIFGVLGPNGAGKTTMLNMLATLLPITEGSGEIFGYDVAKQSHQVRQLLGLTGQYASVDESLTATENLRMFARLLGFSRSEARTRTDELLTEFSLQDAARKPISQFSGGMRRRLDLAVSLITRPPLIFLDEPTTGLDPRTRGQMWDTIRNLVKDGATVLLTTQYLEEADYLADRIAVIDHGKVVAEGTPDDLKTSVGESSLALSLESSADAERAAAALQKVADREPVFSDDLKHITLALSNANQSADVLIALREAGISIASVAVQKPTLDEAFLTLTGEKAEDSK